MPAPRNDPSSKPASPARTIAVRVLQRTRHTRAFVDELFDAELATQELKPEDRRLAHELVYGVTRWRGRLDFILEDRLPKGLKSLPDRLVDILRVATYELLYLDSVPDYASVSEALTLAAGDRSSVKLKGVANGVLRGIQREPERAMPPPFESDPVGHLTVAESHPHALVERWVALWGPEQAQRLCRAGNQRPRLTARVMLSRTTRERVLEQLASDGVEAEPLELHPAAIRFSGPVQPGTLRPLQDGLLQIQDTAGVFVAPILAPKPGERVWDACCAPGGKTTHLVDLSGGEATIIATDKSPGRLHRLHEAIERMKLGSVKAFPFDPLKDDVTPEGGQDGFDGILLDVPCTGWGTIARRPDLRWRVELTDGPRLAEQAYQLLEHCWKHVKPGGRVVYSTCTLNPEENAGVVERFLSGHSDATECDVRPFIPEASRSELTEAGRLHIWPGTISTDGAFAARLEKMA